MRIKMEDGCCIFVDTVGPSNKAPVLVMHGGPGGNHVGMKKRIHLPYQLFYYDHRAMGLSDRSDLSKWNLKQWTDDAASLIDILGIQGCAVIGQSFGAYVAILLAAEYPELVGSLVLGGAQAKPDLEAMIEKFTYLGNEQTGQIARAFWTDPDSQVADDYAKNCFQHYQANSEFAAAKRGKEGIKLDEELLFYWIKNEYKQLDLTDSAKQIDIPSTVIVGAEDPISPEQTGISLARNLGAELNLVAPVGHALYRDDPGLYADIVEDFLKRRAAI